ncbi:uncharacterized protein [Primulina huaijiensis]|uniref:uncharacterized protein n=1 Tax=Primulina huaijiensis TaxID=1492673 RepID=UPI003CC73F12
MEKYINIEEAQKQKRDALKRERSDRVVRPEERAHKKVNSGDYVHPAAIGYNPSNKRPRLPPYTTQRPGTSSREDVKISPSRRRNQEPERKKASSPVLGVIKMISGRSTDGDYNRARKARGRKECLEVEGVRRNDLVISFGPDDLRGVSLPHNDALVIEAGVANYDVMRVFVHSGNSVNVIFKEALVQMDLQRYQLETVETALFGFAGHAVNSEGEIILPLTLGTRELRKTVMTTFKVVDAPSSYNIILGRPAMNELKAVASTYHQNIKFPVGNQVGEVWGDQSFSRKCYVEVVRVDHKKARREEKGKNCVEEVERVAEKEEVHFVAEEEQEVQELVGISPLIAYHNLNIIPGSQPVRELLQADYIREIQFPTRLSNVVLVPKAAGKWKICVDFRDLNKACHKYHYLLPQIDQLVDSTSGYELLSFMNAYQGYHQISLAKNDQEKASFITSGGTFCNVVMPFGLKNVGATYQRLMNIVFEKQLGRDVEVYVDDILGKSREISYFISNLEESFATLMRYGIKLNPNKCIFGVKSGKFLGFVVTDRGIEVNPESQFIAYTGRRLQPKACVLSQFTLSKEPSSVELGKYDIEYKPRVAIKAHALSDFFSEMTQPNEEEVWRLFVGGAASLIGCGIGVVITTPSGEKIKLALRIDSKFTNNEANLFSPSYIKDVYKVKNDKMLKYFQLIKTQAESLVDWSIEQIPRDANVEADALAKMTTSLPDVNTRERSKPKPGRSKNKLSVWYPRRLISDNGKQFQGKKITSWCQEMKITQSFTSVAYPQANGQTEVINRVIAHALKARLQRKRNDWVEELPGVLSTYRTTPRAPTRKTHFNLVYDSEAVLPVEIRQSSAWVMELDLVEEKKDQIMIRMEAYRSRIMKSYNKRVRIRDFQIGDLVMKKVNPSEDVGKLKVRWGTTL